MVTPGTVHSPTVLLTWRPLTFSQVLFPWPTATPTAMAGGCLYILPRWFRVGTVYKVYMFYLLCCSHLTYYMLHLYGAYHMPYLVYFMALGTYLRVIGHTDLLLPATHLHGDAAPPWVMPSSLYMLYGCIIHVTCLTPLQGASPDGSDCMPKPPKTTHGLA